MKTRKAHIFSHPIWRRKRVVGCGMQKQQPTDFGLNGQRTKLLGENQNNNTYIKL